MHIKRENGLMIMSELIVCENYSDMKHFTNVFEKVSDNEYKCSHCGTVMEIKEPILIQDDKGRLKIQVATESK